MSMTRRTAAKGGLFGLATALTGITTGMAKDNKPGGFGATASVSVNSGNNSGNQTFQENQAILTMDSTGNIQLQQGNASDGTVQQGQQAGSSPAITPANGADCGCGSGAPDGCEVLTIMISGKGQVDYVPAHCLGHYCRQV